MDKKEIYTKVVDILHDTFEIPKEDISMDSLIQDDLDLDSIDAVDLIVKLKQYTNRSIDPLVFKKVKTVGDIVDALEVLVKENKNC